DGHREDQKLSSIVWEASRGWFPVMSDRKTLHLGMDLGLPGAEAKDSLYGTPVRSIGEGEIAYAYAGFRSEDGFDWGSVVVKHDTGKGIAWVLYLHLFGVKGLPGQKVKAGDVLGYVGHHGDFNH